MPITTAEELINEYKRKGPPRRYAFIDFLPDDATIRTLTLHFRREFAVIFLLGKKGYHIYTGTISSVDIPGEATDILLKHSHPLGTTLPSNHDHDWLESVQEKGSPQVQSIILPIGKERVRFNINTPYISLK